MSSKAEYKDDYKDNSEAKYAEGKDDGEEKDTYDNYDKPAPPTVEVTSIKVSPAQAELTAGLRLKIVFELDRDAIAAYWEIKFLVDCTHRRIIKMLGQTDVDDYPDGESEMNFSVDSIDVSGISPSTLANSGLLMAVLMVDGEEVASVNMVSMHTFVIYCIGSILHYFVDLYAMCVYSVLQVVNVSKKDGVLVREILSPLD